MTVVGTTAVMLWQGGKKQSFVIEADPANSGTVRISSIDPSVVSSFVSLIAGQQQTFYSFGRSIWAIASAAGQLVYVELLDDTEGAVVFPKGP
jgi:hypothetical protein